MTLRASDGVSPGDQVGGSDREPVGQRRRVILLVEDNEADRDVYGGLLWYNGYDVVHAGDGAAAVESALRSPPDLVLLDISLPGGMSGLEVAKRLREHGLVTPIVALTAHPQEELGDAARDAGMVGYLEKPIDPFAVVKEVVRRVGFASGRQRDS